MALLLLFMSANGSLMNNDVMEYKYVYVKDVTCISV